MNLIIALYFFAIYSMKINRNEYLHISIFNYKIIILSDQ
jgi:hypothetical protein